MQDNFHIQFDIIINQKKQPINIYNLNMPQTPSNSIPNPPQNTCLPTHSTYPPQDQSLGLQYQNEQPQPQTDGQQGFKHVRNLMCCSPVHAPYSGRRLVWSFWVLVFFVVGGYGGCTNGVDNCQNCMNGMQCGTCYPGFYKITTTLSGGQISTFCQTCAVPYCTTCPTDPNTCTACQQRYALANPTTCAACIDSNCLQCSTANQNHCTLCEVRYGLMLTNGNRCAVCSDTKCVRCASDYTKCTMCTTYHGVVTSTGSCDWCLQPNCFYCGADYTQCTVCSVGYGLNTDNGTCERCLIQNCYQCGSNYSECYSCYNTSTVISSRYGYNAISNLCQLCTSTNCLDCSRYNIQVCYQCIQKYGPNPTTQSCQPCTDPNCLTCSPSSTCTACNPTHALIGSACLPCEQPCLQCASTNTTHCTACLPGYFINGSTCASCTGAMYYCLECTNGAFCTKCGDGFYQLNGDGLCYYCPGGCSRCFYDTTTRIVQCTACLQYYYLPQPLTSTRQCLQICGDSISITTPCDLGTGTPYDGCTDSCQIEPGFQCTIVALVSNCSYVDVLQMEVIGLERDIFVNWFVVEVRVWPPLDVFRGGVDGVFGVDHPGVSVIGVQYLYPQSIVRLKLSFTQSLHTNFTILFTPHNSPDQRYTLTPDSSTSCFVDLKFLDDATKNYFNILKYVTYCIVAMAYVGLVLGLFVRKLAGIEAVFVVQIAWIALLGYDGDVEYFVRGASGLVYGVGFGVKLFSSIQNPPSIQTIQTLNTSFYSLDPHTPANNFNLLLLPQLLSLLIFILTSILQRTHAKKQKSQHLLKEYQKMHETKQRLKKIEFVRECSAQVLLTLGLVNLVGWGFGGWMGAVGAGGGFGAGSGVNVGFFVGSSVVVLASYLAFFFQPDPFDYFRYSFKKSSRLYLSYYYMYPFIILATTITTLQFPTHPYLPAIPITLTLLYTLLARPYKQQKQNLRQVFNHLVMLSWLGMRIYLRYSAPQTQNKSQSELLYLVANMGLLLVVVLVAWGFLAYWVYVGCVKVEKEDLEGGVMEQLEVMDVRRKMKDVPVEDTVFKKILSPKMNILTYSNSLLPQDYFFQKQFQLVNQDPQSPKKIQMQLHHHKQHQSKQQAIRQKLQTESFRKRIPKQLLTKKITYINELRNLVEQQQLQAGQTPEVDRKEAKKLVYAMEVMERENEFIRLKNANDYTNELMEQERERDAGERKVYIEEYENI